MQQGGVALTNRGQQFNTALADLYPFATNVDSVLAVLQPPGPARHDARCCTTAARCSRP